MLEHGSLNRADGSGSSGTAARCTRVSFCDQRALSLSVELVRFVAHANLNAKRRCRMST